MNSKNILQMQRFTCCVLLCMLCTTACPGAEGDAKSAIVEITPQMVSLVDTRIAAIVEDPKIMAKLDQKSIFRDEAVFLQDLDGGISRISALLPEVWRTSKHLSTHRRYALCLRDERLFFWVRRVDRDLVGWVPLGSTSRIGKDAKCVFWIVPRLRRQTEFTDLWRSRKNGTDQQEWITDILQSAMNCKVRESEFTKRETYVLSIDAVAEESYYSKYPMQATVFDEMVEVRVDILSEMQKSSHDNKPRERFGSIYTEPPQRIPGWPPTIGTIGGTGVRPTLDVKDNLGSK